MKAWQLDRLGGRLRLNEVPVPEVRPGSVLVRIMGSMSVPIPISYTEMMASNWESMSS